MLGGPKHRTLTFFSTAQGEEKGAMLVNLAASLAQNGSDVVLLDTCHTSRGIAAGIDTLQNTTLLNYARRECLLEELVQDMPQGFGVAAMAPADEPLDTTDAQVKRGLTDAFAALATRANIVVVDAELGNDDSFPISTLASSDIVVQVSTSPDSITRAYAVIKRLNNKLGKRPFGIVVTDASEKEAQVVYKNMAQAANRYLSVKLNSLGCVPADEHLTRAASLGRAVVEAFPLASASAAFRQLAAKFVPSEAVAEEWQGLASNSASLQF